MKLRYKIFFLSLFFFLFGIQFTVSAQQAYGPPQAGGPSPPGNYSSGQGQRGGAPPNNIRPTAVSEVPAEINFDFASNRGEFSRYLFTVVDSPYPLEEGFKLAKEANFKVIGLIHFLTPPGIAEEKARFLSNYDLEGVIYWEQEALYYLPEQDLKRKIDQLINTINGLTKKYPKLRIKTFLFGNEPDIPGKIHWKGTLEEFCANYATFVSYMKSKNKDYVIGSPGFAPEFFFRGQREFAEKFLKYLYEHNIPIDFIAFHSYEGAVKPSYTDQMAYYKNLLQRYPVKSPIFGTPKLANNEYDLCGHPLDDGKYYYFKEMDDTWRAAHNIMSLMSMAHDGIWLASEFAGPFRVIDPAMRDMDFPWVNQQGTIKPVYYAHKAFNALAPTVQIAQQGSNYETFGALGGKSKDGKSVTIVLANYDENAYQLFHPVRPKGPPRQSPQVKVYKHYKVSLKNLPWSPKDRIKIDRFLVNDSQKLTLVDSWDVEGGRELSFIRPTATPEVQLIVIQKK